MLARPQGSVFFLAQLRVAGRRRPLEGRAREPEGARPHRLPLPPR